MQEHEFALEEFGYTATRHQREVGAGYFDLVTQAVSPDSSTLALKGSTEEAQFERSCEHTRRRRRSSRPRRSSSSRACIATLNPTRLELLERRRERQLDLDAGELPGFLPETATCARRMAGRRRAAPTCIDRRCEITGPVERKMMINALNSGARVFMADFEDANSPTWENVVEGQRERPRRRAPRDLARDARRRATG